MSLLVVRKRISYSSLIVLLACLILPLLSSCHGFLWQQDPEEENEKAAPVYFKARTPYFIQNVGTGNLIFLNDSTMNPTRLHHYWYLDPVAISQSEDHTKKQHYLLRNVDQDYMKSPISTWCETRLQVTPWKKGNSDLYFLHPVTCNGTIGKFSYVNLGWGTQCVTSHHSSHQGQNALYRITSYTQQLLRMEEIMVEIDEREVPHGRDRLFNTALYSQLEFGGGPNTGNGGGAKREQRGSVAITGENGPYHFVISEILIPLLPGVRDVKVFGYMETEPKIANRTRRPRPKKLPSYCLDVESTLKYKSDRGATKIFQFMARLFPYDTKPGNGCPISKRDMALVLLEKMRYAQPMYYNRERSVLNFPPGKEVLQMVSSTSGFVLPLLGFIGAIILFISAVAFYIFYQKRRDASIPK